MKKTRQINYPGDTNVQNSWIFMVITCIELYHIICTAQDIHDDLKHVVFIHCSDMPCCAWILSKTHVTFSDILGCKINDVVLFITCNKNDEFPHWKVLKK